MTNLYTTRFYKYLRTAATLLAILFCISSVRAADNGNWRQHPAFDTGAYRIVETPRYTYFQVHPHLYQTNRDNYKEMNMKVLVYDNQNPDKGIHALADLYPLSDNRVRIMNYNPWGKYLFLGYENGYIDIIFDNGEKISVSDLHSPRGLNMNILTSVHFQPETSVAWIATEGGFAAFDAATRKFTRISFLGTPIQEICKFGNEIIAFTPALKAYTAPADKVLPSFKDFSPLQIKFHRSLFWFSKGTPVEAQLMMPLTDNAFAYLNYDIAGKSKERKSLHVCVKGEEGWTFQHIVNSTVCHINTVKKTVGTFENNCLTTEKGYMVFSNDTVYNINRAAFVGKTDAEIIDPSTIMSYKVLSRKAPSTLGTWNTNDYWEYAPRGQFVRTTAADNGNGSTTWSDLGEPIRPNAPAAYWCESFASSPEHGIITTNLGTSWKFSQVTQYMPALVSKYKGGKWTVPAPVYNPPTSVKANPAYLNVYNSNPTRFPLTDPTSMILDPLHKNKLLLSGLTNGIIVMDLEDPDHEFFHFTSNAETFCELPGSVVNFPTQGWIMVNQIMGLGADYNNVIWGLFNNMAESQSDQMRLYYWTPEARATAYNLPAGTSPEPWPYISLNLETITNPNYTMAVCKTYENRGKIIFYSGVYDSPLYIYDTNGTPDVTRDDVMQSISIFRTSNGYRHHIEYFNDIVEDPVSKRIWIAGPQTLLSFDPCTPVLANTVEAERIKLLSDINDNDREAFLESSQINKITFDEYGRMWLATENDGLVGINRERNAVIAHYTTNNSPIPSNRVIGMGWDVTTKSLMVSTYAGMAQVYPDAISTSTLVTEGLPYAYPQVVERNYSGAVTAYNIPALAHVVIRDTNGKLIRQLGIANDGRHTWNLDDENGKQVRSGRYIFTDALGQMPDFEVIVIR